MRPQVKSFCFPSGTEILDIDKKINEWLDIQPVNFWIKDVKICFSRGSLFCMVFLGIESEK